MLSNFVRVEDFSTFNVYLPSLTKIYTFSGGFSLNFKPKVWAKIYIWQYSDASGGKKLGDPIEISRKLDKYLISKDLIELKKNICKLLHLSKKNICKLL